MRPFVFACLLYVAFFGVPAPPTITLPSLPSIVAPSVSKADRAVYVYEMDAGGVHPDIRGAISRVNLETPVVADFYEDNPSEEAKPAYRIALEAAKKEGLPSLVVLAGDKVIRVVKSPATAEAVMEAVK